MSSPTNDYDAEYRRVIEERFVTLYAQQRTLGFLLMASLFCAALWGLTLLPGAREFLRVPPSTMGPLMALQAGAFAVATVCAHYFGGVLGAPHRLAERAETLVTALVASSLIYLSGSATSFFWFLVVTHALHATAETSSARFVRWSHAGSLALAALAFMRDGRSEDAAIIVFCGAVIFFLAHTQEQSNQRVLDLEVERNLLRRRVEGMLVDQERQRIARDLHDGLGAQLASMAWMADAQLVDGSDAQDKLRELSERARAGLTDLRHVVQDLKTQDMRLDELAEAVETRCRGLISTACSFAVEHRGELKLAHGPCAQLELMIRESVRNAVQHGSPASILVALEGQEDALLVSIRDDGRGFATGDVERRPGGLTHLRERATLLGAALQIQSSAAGTTVTIRARRDAVTA